LLLNGDFEAGNVDWLETSANYGQVIFIYGYIPTLQPHSDPYVAWLGGGEALMSEDNSLAQTLAVPWGTTELELSFFYQVWADELPDSQNSLHVSLGPADSDLAEAQVVTLYNQDYTRVWSHFSAKMDATAVAGSEVTLEFRGAAADGYTHFFIDSVELLATVCD
jgi:hypothetical protein